LDLDVHETAFLSSPGRGELQIIEIVERSGQHSDDLWIPASLVSLLVKDL
jgi:hypothetical protein